MDVKYAMMDGLHNFLYSEQYSVYRNVAAVVGGLYVGKLLLRELWRIWGGLRVYFLAPLGSARTDLRKYGQWAVITGGSDGIGRGYALELARRGLDVVIMSRSRDKLDKVAQEIRSKYKEREVRVFPVDFSRGEEIYPDIAEELKDLDIGILVNNVGISNEYPEFFCNQSPKFSRRVVELNVQSMVLMCRIVLPGMDARGRGVVVNVSSGTQDIPLPLALVYSATKAFVKAFSDGLRQEYAAAKGIYIQNVAPWLVVSAMTKSAALKEGLFTPDAIKYTRAAVSTIGIQENTHGYWPHALQGRFLASVPRFLRDRMLFHQLVKQRQKAIEKLAKEQ